MKKSFTKNMSGFTLIELLVVVLIIGILSSIALPQYRIAVEKARMAEPLSMIGSLTKAIDVYLLANGMPNYSEDDGNVEFVGNSNITLDADVEAVLDCPDDADFCYSEHYSYDVYCYDGGCTISIEQQNEDYRLYVNKYDVNGTWTRECSSLSSLGDKICKSMEPQGWSVSLYE